MSQRGISGRTSGSYGQPSGPPGLGFAIFAVVGSCFIWGWHAVLATAVTAVVSLAVGAWNALPISVAAMGDIAVQLLSDPGDLLGSANLESLVLGMLAGAVIAWLRSAMHVKERYDTLTSAVFSSEPLRVGGLDFAVLLIINIVAGYLVMLAFSVIGIIGSGPGPVLDLHDAVTIVMGGGPPPGGDGGLFGAFFLVLAALFVVGAIVGAVSGGALGCLYGLGLSVFHPSHLIFGAAQGGIVRWLTERKEAKGKQGAIAHLIVGTAFGALEGTITGAVSGGLLGLWHLFY